MARLRDIKIDMKVQIVKGKEKPEDFNHYDAYDHVGEISFVTAIDKLDQNCAVKVSNGWYYPASWIKIIKDEGETEMTKPIAKPKKVEVSKPQEYVLMDEEDISQKFTDGSTKGIFNVSYDAWGWDALETTERIKSGKMKLFKIEEVKLEVTEPSIKIVG